VQEQSRKTPGEEIAHPAGLELDPGQHDSEEAGNRLADRASRLVHTHRQLAGLRVLVQGAPVGLGWSGRRQTHRDTRQHRIHSAINSKH